MTAINNPRTPSLGGEQGGPPEVDSRGSMDRGVLPFLRRNLSILGPVVVLVLMFTFFAFASRSFLSLGNMQALGQLAGETLLVSAAATVVILLGSIDLSVGAIAGLCGMTLAFTTQSGWPLGAALALSIGLGILAGLTNGLLFVIARIPSFLATLGMLFILPGIAVFLYGSAPISFDNAALSNVLFSAVAGVPLPLIVGFVLVLGLAAILRWTVFGQHVYVVGGNERVARMSGVRVRQIKIAVFVISGLFCAIAGILLTVRISSATSGMGSNLLLLAIAATVIGGTR